jgi:hypothetical protein
MHTDSSNREDRFHSSYEQAVDRRVNHRYPFTLDEPDRVRPYTRTVKLARGAHRLGMGEYCSVAVIKYDSKWHNFEPAHDANDLAKRR